MIIPMNLLMPDHERARSKAGFSFSQSFLARLLAVTGGLAADLHNPCPLRAPEGLGFAVPNAYLPALMAWLVERRNSRPREAASSTNSRATRLPGWNLKSRENFMRARLLLNAACRGIWREHACCPRVRAHIYSLCPNAALQDWKFLHWG